MKGSQILEETPSFWLHQFTSTLAPQISFVKVNTKSESYLNKFWYWLGISFQEKKSLNWIGSSLFSCRCLHWKTIEIWWTEKNRISQYILLLNQRIIKSIVFRKLIWILYCTVHVIKNINLKIKITNLNQFQQ